MTFNIVKHRKIWFAGSAVLLVSSFIAIALCGLRFGIDFTGGSLLELKMSKSISTTQMSSEIGAMGYKDVIIQSTDNNGAIVRMESLTETRHQELLKSLNDKYGNVEEMKFDSIGPVIGNELRTTATAGVIIVLVLIGLYISFAFRKVMYPVESWKYGVLTILAAFHDVIVPVGVFAILGKYLDWEIGTAFVAAVLTVLGYSITDTIVVFDRTRENLLKRTGQSFEDTVEKSVKQTLTRSISTSLTTLLALTAIFFFGGESTRPFALALIIGIISGTYSSIFLASCGLVTWQLSALKRK